MVFCISNTMLLGSWRTTNKSGCHNHSRSVVLAGAPCFQGKEASWRGLKHAQGSQCFVHVGRALTMPHAAQVSVAERLPWENPLGSHGVAHLTYNCGWLTCSMHPSCLQCEAVAISAFAQLPWVIPLGSYGCAQLTHHCEQVSRNMHRSCFACC